MREVTVVGGGLAGLVAAITAAEAGASVVLLEAQAKLGGRACSASGPFVANFGPHALYKGLSNWHWLKQRDLLPATVTPRATSVRFYASGRMHKTLPLSLLRALPLIFADAPNDQDFRSWLSAKLGERNAALLSGYAGVLTFHHDPGSLSAAFVAERFRWVYLPPSIRFVKGGWSQLVACLQRRLGELGVRVKTGERVRDLPEPPVIVASELSQARALLGDETLRCDGATAVLLDIGLRSRRCDPGAVIDLDRGALVERFSAWDKSLAPPGCELIQAHVGISDSEQADRGIAHLENLLDKAYAGWRERVVWRRRQLSSDRSGAVDLPGRSWRDRPAIDRGGGVFLAGDMVAAPGFLGEVSFTSAQQAAQVAVRWKPSVSSVALPAVAKGRLAI
jgi:FAD dependent oxidoreductase